MKGRNDWIIVGIITYLTVRFDSQLQRRVTIEVSKRLGLGVSLKTKLESLL